MKTLHLTLAAASLLTACATPQAGGGGKGGAIAVAVDRVMPMNESLDASAVEVTLRVANPTEKPMKIQSIEYEIDTLDVAGKIPGTADVSADLEADQTAELRFRQSIPFPKEAEAYKAILDKKTIPANVSGKLKLVTGESFAFEKASEVATPLLPRFEVHDAQAARYGKEGVDVTIFLRLVNDNVFPVLIQGVVYTVFVADKELKTEQAAVGVRLLPAAAEEYEAGSQLDASSFDKAKLKDILTTKKVSYKVVGKIEIERLTLPFEHTGEITLATGE